ncbi:DUF1059 domain-containing protein [Sneathiella glossodoripedis]|uniref:DUF1059 domain-containing protein n=1 Tax=Sneathiella glossodoripedis TaxID=418853 RepID=UPI000A065410|nr:DUF1059 domain-containing protein [Sneathiella glossodoripedis]
MKKIECNDLFEGCAFRASASTEDELLQKVAAHAAKEHNIQEITPEVLAKVKSCIKSG